MIDYNDQSLTHVVRDNAEGHLLEVYFYADAWIEAYSDGEYLGGYPITAFADVEPT